MLGLSELEVSLYRELLRMPRRGRAEMAKSLGAPEAEIGAAISRLTEMSLIRRSWEDPFRFVPVNPEIAVAGLVAVQEERLLRERLDLEQQRAELARLVAEHCSASLVPGDSGAQRLVGIDAIRSRVEELAHRSSTEIMSFSTGMMSFSAGQDGREVLPVSRIVDHAALERGLALRGLYLESILNHTPAREHARWLSESGAEIRLAVVLPITLFIFDRQAALLPADPERQQMGALTLTGGGVLTALVALFESYWDHAKPLADPRPAVRDEISLSDRELLRLLARGSTDETVARHLGVSPRTVRRRVSEINLRLGAGSRFQAGVLAVRQGWI